MSDGISLQRELCLSPKSSAKARRVSDSVSELLVRNLTPTGREQNLVLKGENMRPKHATLDRPNTHPTRDRNGAPEVSRDKLIELLNEDLAREYQATIAYVVYSQVLKGAAYMKIAEELELHAGQELEHAITIAKQIDYLGGSPTVTPKPVKSASEPEEMLRADLENENETIRNYRQRVRQCEAMGEYAMAEHIRKILVQEQEHQIDLATALGVDVPEVTSSDERA
jgi:bacterioferritin